MVRDTLRTSWGTACSEPGARRGRAAGITRMRRDRAVWGALCSCLARVRLHPGHASPTRRLLWVSLHPLSKAVGGSWRVGPFQPLDSAYAAPDRTRIRGFLLLAALSLPRLYR